MQLTATFSALLAAVAASAVLTSANTHTAASKGGLMHRNSANNQLQHSFGVHSRASSSGIQGKGAVQWDDKSIYVAGERIFLYAEEFHPYRLPSPGLWRDVLQKIKSANFNAISIYTFWGAISPRKGVAHIDSFNDLEQFLQVAKDVGIFIILRPGPYINAETTNGGIAPWLHNEPGIMRQNSTAYVEGQKPYLEAITNVARKYQVALGKDGKLDPTSGPIIVLQVENEYSDSPPERQSYFDDLKAFYKGNGIVVPMSFNDCCSPAKGNFANDIDLYGQDGYPLGFDCSNPTVWGGVQTSIYDSFNSIKPSQAK